MPFRQPGPRDEQVPDVPFGADERELAAELHGAKTTARLDYSRYSGSLSLWPDWNNRHRDSL